MKMKEKKLTNITQKQDILLMSMLTCLTYAYVGMLMSMLVNNFCATVAQLLSGVTGFLDAHASLEPTMSVCVCLSVCLSQLAQTIIYPRQDLIILD